MKKVLEINRLDKYYGKALGVKNVNLAINEGEVFGFIGPNGAGKSTTIKCIMDLINKTVGEIYINENMSKRDDIDSKEIMGYLPSEIHLYEDLTVMQMLEYSNSFYKKDCMKKAKELIKLLDVDTKKKIDELSFGNLKKVGIIIALMHDPKFIIMDEATNGLDPLMQEEFYEIIKKEKNAGKTIFFSSHNLNEIKRICDRVAIIKEGSIIEVSTIEDLTNANYFKVTIRSKKVKDISKKLKSTVITEKENELKIMYDKDINDLLKTLEQYKIDKLLIEEPSIEEILMHFYK